MIFFNITKCKVKHRFKAHQSTAIWEKICLHFQECRWSITEHNPEVCVYKYADMLVWNMNSLPLSSLCSLYPSRALLVPSCFSVLRNPSSRLCLTVAWLDVNPLRAQRDMNKPNQHHHQITYRSAQNSSQIFPSVSPLFLSVLSIYSSLYCLWTTKYLMLMQNLTADFKELQ